jgi:hypothetical protein
LGVKAKFVQNAKGTSGQTVTTAFVARKKCLINDDNIMPSGSQCERRSNTARPCSNNKNIARQIGSTVV